MSKYVKIEDVMAFINTSNRGSADYFIVDQIEDLCKNKAKTLEELKAEQDAQKCSKKVVAKYSYEHNDGDQIWEDENEVDEKSFEEWWDELDDIEKEEYNAFMSEDSKELPNDEIEK